jgi:hypothetical protein
MKGYASVTDNDWFDLLLKQPEVDEVNSWKAGRKVRQRYEAQGTVY